MIRIVFMTNLNLIFQIYDKFEFDIPIGSGEKGTVGDCWDRYIVRIREMEQSVRILRQAVERFPTGEIKAKKAPI